MKLFKAITKSFRDEAPREPRAQAEDRRTQAAAQNNLEAAGPGTSRQVSGSRSRNTRADAACIEASSMLLLKHLKIGNEADHDLVAIPVMDRIGGHQPMAEPDDRTEHLSGVAYIEYLGTDDRLLPALRQLIKRKILINASHLPEAARNQIVKKLRLIAGEAYRDADLAMRLENLALDWGGLCGDRAEYILSQLHGEALLANLRRGNLDDVSLYNIGVSFFRLSVLHEEMIRRKPQIFRAHQSVHEFYEIEYRLQDRLQLPFKHDPQMFPGNSPNATPEFIEELAAAVQQRCSQNDGEAVIAFLAQWEPWDAVVRNDPKNREGIEALTGSFQEILDEYETNRQNPDKAESKHTEQQVLDFMNNVMQRRQEWNTEFLGQKAREFLVNHRACIVLDHGLSSSYLNR